MQHLRNVNQHKQHEGLNLSQYSRHVEAVLVCSQQIAAVSMAVCPDSFLGGDQGFIVCIDIGQTHIHE